MPYSWPGRAEQPTASIAAAAPAAFFVSSFVLLVFSCLVPSFLAPHPAAVFMLVLTVALLTAVYRLLVQGLQFPFLVRLVFFCGGQWLFLAAWLWTVKGVGLPAALHPLLIINSEGPRLAMTIITSLLTRRFIAPAGRLQKRPRVENSSGRRVVWEGTVNRVDVSFWETEWQSGRTQTIFLMLAGILAVPGAMLLIPDWKPDLPARCWLVLFLVTGVLFLAQLHFYYRRALWKAEGMEPDRGMARLWRRWVFLITGAAAGVSILLPAGFPGLGSLLAGLFRRRVTVGSRQEFHQPLPKIKAPPPGLEASEPNLWEQILAFFVFFLIYVFFPLLLLACLVAVAGWVLFRLGRGEIHRWQGLRRALVQFFLFWRGLWEEWWHARARKQGLPARKKRAVTPEGGGEERPRKKKMVYAWGKGHRAVIRRGYFHLVRQAHRQGLPRRKSQTPGEIAGGLREIIPGEAEKINKLTDNYRQARYSPREPSRLLARVFEQLRRAVQKRLAGLARER